jgi:hypothetical protein
MRVVCINSEGRPDRIPSEKWVKKNQVYTVVKAVNLAIGNTLAFELEEIKLTEENFPYEYFAAQRFVPEKHYLELEKYKSVNWDIPLTIE